MERLLIFIVSFVVLISCGSTEKKHLELKILNKNFVTYAYGTKTDTINYIEYFIENKSKINYFINYSIDEESIFFDSILNQNNITKNKLRFKIFNKFNNKEVEYNSKIYPRFRDQNFIVDSIITRKISTIENEEYRRIYQDEHFENDKDLLPYFLHKKHDNIRFLPAGEKIYGKLYLNITDTMAYEDNRSSYAKLFFGQDYYLKMQIISDSTNYKNKYPNHILRRIKDNNYKVYHGIIESKNKVTVKVIN